ncbi:hypothetical protein H7H82_13300 [Mycobacterium heidelbergense]|uniref:Uncharacterized protein n=1 Tax=Mycobacterium heidelbergense TaxID=53376 RepID=A0A1X0DH42_MYCHE|nr:hypothetical protein [Mycobacterium heidelbergense]MCV7051556.1 hypothetical protein [Mycobacterium heidelbergense]ORA71701.1 hypothetical protein BST25_16180 [Mycobacterium heidelbergense]BBZ52940.1 hypothetical protein MHEI_46570 [Mycobacterium heidelbergense]
MQQLAAFRPLVTAGAAAVGASLIALTPSVSNDVAAGLQHSVVNIQHRAVELADAVNPVQSWIDLFQTTGANLQAFAQTWGALPFPVAQQAAANWLYYGDFYITTMQSGASGASNYFGGQGPTAFFPLLTTAFTDLQAGNVSGFVNNLTSAFWTQIFLQVLQPMENTLAIPREISTNFANFVNTLIGTTNVQYLGIYVFTAPGYFMGVMGDSLQAAVNSANSGDLVGAITNLLNTPPVTLDALLNGSISLLSPPASGSTGFVYALDNVLNSTAKAMVTPGAQNMVNGGSLAAASSAFLSQLTTGWPAPQVAFDGVLNGLTQFIQSLFPSLGGAGAATAADVVNGGSALAGLSAGLPGLAANALKGFEPALATDIAAALGPSLAANVAGPLATATRTLSVDLSTIALHILAAL